MARLVQRMADLTKARLSKLDRAFELSTPVAGWLAGRRKSKWW